MAFVPAGYRRVVLECLGGAKLRKLALNNCKDVDPVTELIYKLCNVPNLYSYFFQDEDHQSQPGDILSAVPKLTIDLKEVGNKFNLQVV